MNCLLSTADIAEERDKFVADALRLAEDVSKNQTFNTVQPLLNFWAAFTPSEEVGILLRHVRNIILNENHIFKSGIGVNGIPKKCACYE